MNDYEIISTRTLPFKRELVFKAWSDPKHLAKWWGPKGFTNTFHEFDFRPGGKWRFTMHGPDGGNYANECVFTEIAAPGLIKWYRLSQPLFRMDILFEEWEGKTKLVFKMIFETEKECNKIKKIAVNANEENFDRLEAGLAKMIV
jgi:uncharacterized protein YndB with AHSA1/START domain